LAGKRKKLFAPLGGLRQYQFIGTARRTAKPKMKEKQGHREKCGVATRLMQACRRLHDAHRQKQQAIGPSWGMSH
jgi:hypothetical protein